MHSLLSQSITASNIFIRKKSIFCRQRIRAPWGWPGLPLSIALPLRGFCLLDTFSVVVHFFKASLAICLLIETQLSGVWRRLNLPLMLLCSFCWRFSLFLAVASVWSSKQCDYSVRGGCCYLCFVHWRADFFNINNSFENYIFGMWGGPVLLSCLSLSIHSLSHHLIKLSRYPSILDFGILSFSTQDSGEPRKPERIPRHFSLAGFP